jgi:Xaa-Pro aminopeptidase
MTTLFEKRRRACQERLRAVGADALVLFPGHDLYYLTGFDETPGERHLLFFLPDEGEPAFLVPELYGEQVRETSRIRDVRTWADEAGPEDQLDALVAELDLGGRVLVDDAMHARFTLDLRAAIDAEFGLASEALAALRARKGEAELDALARAGAVADRALEEVRAMGSDAVGLTERDLAEEIERRLAAAGESVAFETIVGSGPNGAKPHHARGERTIEPGDPVVLDFGARVGTESGPGYPSDQTRTIVFDGRPPAPFPEIHETVRAAQAAAVETVAPGVPAGAVDAAAREIIEAAGYGEQFVHRTGHGVGLDVHEGPYIVAGNDRPLEEGMVFSVEPGIYLPGEFGVRIEDLVVVTEGGCERLNHTDRGWRCV